MFLNRVLVLFLIPCLSAETFAGLTQISALPVHSSRTFVGVFKTNALAAQPSVSQKVIPGTEERSGFHFRGMARDLQNSLLASGRLDEVNRILTKLRKSEDLSWIGRESMSAEKRLQAMPVMVNMDSRVSPLPATTALLLHFNAISSRGTVVEDDLRKLLVLYLRAMPEQVQLVDENAAYNNLRRFADTIMNLPIVASGHFVLANLSLVENARGVESYQLSFGERPDEQVSIEVNEGDLVLVSDKWRVRFPGHFYSRYYPFLKTVLAEIQLHRIKQSSRVESVRPEAPRIRIVPKLSEPNFNARTLEELKQLQEVISRVVYGIRATRGVEITSDVVEQILRLARSTSNEVMFVLGVPQEKPPYDEKRGIITYTALKESVEGGAIRVSMAQSRAGHIGHSHPFGDPSLARPITANEDAVYISQFNNTSMRTFASIIVGGSGNRWGIGAWRYPENRTGITTNLDDLYSLPITIIDRNGRALNATELRQLGIVEIVNNRPYLSANEAPENMEDIIALRRWLGDLQSLIKSTEDELRPRPAAFSIRIIAEPRETLLPKGEQLWQQSRFHAGTSSPDRGTQFNTGVPIPMNFVLPMFAGLSVGLLGNLLLSYPAGAWLTVLSMFSFYTIRQGYLAQFLGLLKKLRPTPFFVRPIIASA
jgi:hypothetical protein